jgi:hypothetical protein
MGAYESVGFGWRVSVFEKRFVWTDQSSWQRLLKNLLLIYHF